MESYEGIPVEVLDDLKKLKREMCDDSFAKFEKLVGGLARDHLLEGAIVSEFLDGAYVEWPSLRLFCFSNDSYIVTQVSHDLKTSSTVCDDVEEALEILRPLIR